MLPSAAPSPWAVVALWFVYSYNFGNCLTIAVVHSLEVTRYVRIQLIYTVFAQCLSIYFLLRGDHLWSAIACLSKSNLSLGVDANPQPASRTTGETLHKVAGLILLAVLVAMKVVAACRYRFNTDETQHCT